VKAAIAARRNRHGLVEAKLSALIEEGLLRVETQGERIGQLNGLAILGEPPEAFGKPARITAAAGSGRGGLINIERESHLSGPVHDKGVLILGGYLHMKYGRERPLALTASLAFEQSYHGVDGDSASLAELYCLLSAIAEVPTRQGVAVTGSVDQHGNVQAVGGVNEKIEGFFELCQKRELSGEEGCIIPRSDRDALMLDDRVVEACRDQHFAVYAIENVDDGIPILFGMEADVFHARVVARLEALGRESGGEPARANGATRPPEAKTPKMPIDPRPPSAGR
jgi:predicted ATP-dependent protease